MAQRVVHFEIGAKDAAKLGRFYRPLFGWSIDASIPGYGLVAPAEGGGIGGGILQTEPRCRPT